jgi:hypothetical protein
MMLGSMMSGDVVAKVLGAGVPADAHVFVEDLVNYPKVTHFHGAGPLAFYGVVGDSDGGGVVTMDWRRRLGMSHLVED